MANYSNKALVEQMNTINVQPGCLAIWGLGQMGVAVKGNNGQILYIDPILSDVVAIKIPGVADKFGRAFPPPLQPEDVTNAAYVLCTHEHLDHTDPLTLGPLAKACPQARFIVSGWALELMAEAGIPAEKCILPKVNEPIYLDGMKVTPIPAAHEEIEYDQNKGNRFFSYLIEWERVSLFHSGDTQITPDYVKHLHSLPRADVAILAVNGRDEYRKSQDVLGNLHPAEAVWLAKELGWDVIISGHNDLFEWNTISAGALADAVHKHNPRQKYRCQLQPGELYYYVK